MDHRPFGQNGRFCDRIQRFILWGCIILYVPLFGCSDDSERAVNDEPYQIADTVLEGTIHDSPWVFAVGLTLPELEQNDENVHYVELFSDADVTCDQRSDQSNRLIVTVPKQTGEFSFGPTLNATFAFVLDGQQEYRITFDGALAVIEYEDEAPSFTAALVAQRPEAGKVNGVFTVSKCALKPDDDENSSDPPESGQMMP